MRRSDPVRTVNGLLREQGFTCQLGDPTDEQAEAFVRVMERTGRADLEFKPFVPVLYEKRLSAVTYLIVEGRAENNIYKYDFYKARYYLKNGQPTHVKVYGENLGRQQLIRLIENFLKIGSDSSFELLI